MDEEPNPTLAAITPLRVAVAVAAIGLIASTAMAVGGRPVAGEVALFRGVNGLPWGVGRPLEAVMQLGSFVAPLAVGVVALGTRRHRLALAAIGGWALVRVTSAALKAAVGRARPPALLADVALRQHLPADNGFPSSHAANATALAVAVGCALPRWRVPLAAVAVVVGVARLYVGVHLPLDLVGGWCLGLLCGLAVVALAARLVPDPGRRADS